VRRREFITLLGGAAAAWPLMARAQAPTMPVIGHLDSQAPGTFADFVLPAFRHGLKDTGYVEGENVAIVYRWAENQVDRLPSLAAELVRRRVAVIVASGGPPVALAAKAATTTIPIVFGVGDDPVKIGLVASLARPGGNLTGINFFASELAAKRMELLREMVPAAGRIAVLVDPTFPLTQSQVRDAETAARAMGLQTQVLNASTNREINAAFATFARERSDALYVGASQSACPIGPPSGALRDPRDIWSASIYRSRRAHELWCEAHGCLPSDRHLYRSHPKGHEAGRLAGRAVN
jgi:ABC transporter substrate binding protein